MVPSSMDRKVAGILHAAANSGSKEVFEVVLTTLDARLTPDKVVLIRTENTRRSRECRVQVQCLVRLCSGGHLLSLLFCAFTEPRFEGNEAYATVESSPIRLTEVLVIKKHLALV